MFTPQEIQLIKDALIITYSITEMLNNSALRTGPIEKPKLKRVDELLKKLNKLGYRNKSI